MAGSGHGFSGVLLDRLFLIAIGDVRLGPVGQRRFGFTPAWFSVVVLRLAFHRLVAIVYWWILVERGRVQKTVVTWAVIVPAASVLAKEPRATPGRQPAIATPASVMTRQLHA